MVMEIPKLKTEKNIVKHIVKHIYALIIWS